ncbi:signal peptidase I [Deinococcus aquaedulcis]|uniref:signal peptidase I n=1 Tax=Deinococcus aquaedulcis TaxID=2840455 RepID=UPI001C82F57A|nr:signal peptidase I [Deinococcus aquaedulcis]
MSILPLPDPYPRRPFVAGLLGFALGPLGLLYTSTLLAIGTAALLFVAWPWLLGAEWRLWAARVAFGLLAFLWAEYQPPMNGWPRLLRLDRPGKRKALLVGLGLVAAGLGLSQLVTYTRTSSPVMLPTVAPGEFVRVQRRFDRQQAVQRGTLVVYRIPFSGTQALSRVVALPGDRVELRRALLYVNGQVADDPARIQALRAAGCMEEALPLNNEAQIGEAGAVTVPLDHVFVLADNRADLFEDSRTFGPVALDQVVGLVQANRRPLTLTSAQCRLKPLP